MASEKKYGRGFFATRHQKTKYSAETILGLILPNLPDVRSVADIGCGVGTWLEVAREKGATSIAGYDGPWVDRELLQIPEHCFHQTNLAESLEIDGEVDLAICLEVMEHIPEDSAKKRMDLLLSRCRFLLFGAAVPLQGGTGHINEKSQSYWVDYITSRGFLAYDPIRWKIWNDEPIPYWYKQNMLLYVNSREAALLPDEISRYQLTAESLINVIHPQLLEKLNRKIERRNKNPLRRLARRISGNKN